ncbi:unnamed protein product [Rotaria sp. Silwood1]|nr:unnamed protein product [Rotaria sp. Silwood1]
MDNTPSSNNSSQATDDCTICLTSLTPGTPLLTLSCNHKFHFQCLALNIQAKNNECPLCRATIDASVLQLLGNPSQQLSTQSHLTPLPQTGQVSTNDANAIASAATIPSVEDLIDETAARVISERFIAARQAAVISLNEANNFPMITAITTLEREAQVPHEESSLYGLITLQAPPALQFDNQPIMQSRAPIDLVCIVDQSGSMGGQKIALLKKTLIDIVDQLGELDRLAIISFNTDAIDRSHGLRRMTQQNQQVLKTEINSISSEGGTYIGSGLQMGIDLVVNRQTKNPLAALLVLTDGHDNQEHNYTQIMSTLPEGVQCYTFGYGLDHNAQLLVKLAEQGNDGTFTYIDEERAVSTAFSMTLISHFLSQYKYEPEQLPSMKLSIKLPNLNADEKRNLVFQFYVPKVNDDQNVDMSSQQSTTTQSETATEQNLFEKQIIGHVSVSYIDPNTTHSITTPQVPFYFIRAPNLPADLLRVNYQLDRQRNRIETIEALERAMAERDYEQSRVILASQVEKLKASVSAQDPFCQELIRDLEYSFPSEQEYRSTHYTSSRCHATERGAYLPTSTTSSGRYHTRRQQELIERYKRNVSP